MMLGVSANDPQQEIDIVTNCLTLRRFLSIFGIKYLVEFQKILLQKSI